MTKTTKLEGSCIKETLGEYVPLLGGWRCRLFAHTVLSVVSIKYARSVKLLDVLHQTFFAFFIFVMMAHC